MILIKYFTIPTHVHPLGSVWELIKLLYLETLYHGYVGVCSSQVGVCALMYVIFVVLTDHAGVGGEHLQCYLVCCVVR